MMNVTEKYGKLNVLRLEENFVLLCGYQERYRINYVLVVNVKLLRRIRNMMIINYIQLNKRRQNSNGCKSSYTGYLY
jgi:hypothetical protein